LNLFYQIADTSTRNGAITACTGGLDWSAPRRYRHPDRLPARAAGIRVGCTSLVRPGAPQRHPQAMRWSPVSGANRKTFTHIEFSGAKANAYVPLTDMKVGEA